MEITAVKVDPHDREKAVSRFSVFSAIDVEIDGHKLLVMIYANGPTHYHNHLMEHIMAVERSCAPVQPLQSK